MKKWALLVMLGAVLLVSVALPGRWIESALATVVANQETVAALTKLVKLLSGVLGLAAGVAGFWGRKAGGRGKGPVTAQVQAKAAGDATQVSGSGNVTGSPMSAGRDLQVDVIGGNKTVIHQAAQPQPSPQPLHQLPPPPADFTGRKEDLAELEQAILKGGVTITGVRGLGGIGKTALALELARRVKDHYPDAQIFLNLHGASKEKALSASDALAHVIRAFHPDARLPETEAALQALFQSALHGKRVLLVMDNALDAAQVKPIVPPHGCALIVTSRNKFSVPGIREKDLGSLPLQEAEDLLLRIAPRAGREARRILEACGRLPLAIRIAGSTLRETPDLAPSDYADRLADGRDGLSRLRPVDGSEQSLEATFDLSYMQLAPRQQASWRRLGIFPGSFNGDAAVSVMGTEAEEARNALSHFVRLSLLDFREGERRYAMHDLLRDYAQSRLEAAERDETCSAHARHYLGVMLQADRLFRKDREGVRQGLSLLDTEWLNIEAGQAWAADCMDRDPEAAMLSNLYPAAGAFCLPLRTNARQQVRWLEQAVVAARMVGDRQHEGNHVGNLGNAWNALGETGKAIACFEASLAIHRETGNKSGEGNRLGSLGIAHSNLGEKRKAIEFYEQALAIHREIDDRLGQATTLGNLASAYADLQEFGRAVDYCKQALEIDRAIGNRQGEGTDLSILGTLYSDMGDFQQAVDSMHEALAISREIGDRYGEAVRLHNLAQQLLRVGESDQARANLERSLDLLVALESPKAEIVRRQLASLSAPT